MNANKDFDNRLMIFVIPIMFIVCKRITVLFTVL